jgi:DNA-binding PadR family transcriptional regulator
MSYHDNPGQRQSGKCAIAYLPNNAEGQMLLKRLKYAFMHWLTIDSVNHYPILKRLRIG